MHGKYIQNEYIGDEIIIYTFISMGSFFYMPVARQQKMVVFILKIQTNPSKNTIFRSVTA